MSDWESLKKFWKDERGIELKCPRCGNDRLKFEYSEFICPKCGYRMDSGPAARLEVKVRK